MEFNVYNYLDVTVYTCAFVYVWVYVPGSWNRCMPTIRFNHRNFGGIENIPPQVPESTKKHNLNLLYTSNYFHNISIVLGIIGHLEMI